MDYSGVVYGLNENSLDCFDGGRGWVDDGRFLSKNGILILVFFLIDELFLFCSLILFWHIETYLSINLLIFSIFLIFLYYFSVGCYCYIICLIFIILLIELRWSSSFSDYLRHSRKSSMPMILLALVLHSSSLLFPFVFIYCIQVARV